MTELDLGTLTRQRARSTPRDARGCPETTLLARFVADELSPEQRESILDHVEVCPDCALELAAGDEAGRLVPDRFATAATPRASRRRRAGSPAAWRWGAVAASLVLAASALLTLRAHFEPVDALRDAASERWEVRPRDGSRIQAQPPALVWEAPAAGDAVTGYRVTLFDAAFTPLAVSGELVEPTFELPADLRLVRGATYFWRVEIPGVIGRDGTRTFSFALAP